MRTIIKHATYLLDHGRGQMVIVVEITDQFVIHAPLVGGSQVVVDRASFAAEAIIANLWPNPYLHGRRADGGHMIPAASPFRTWGDKPDGRPDTDWCINLELVPDEAYTFGARP